MEYGIKEENIIFRASPKGKLYKFCSDDIKDSLNKLFQRIWQLAPQVNEYAVKAAHNVYLDREEEKIKGLIDNAYNIVIDAVEEVAKLVSLEFLANIIPVQLEMVGKLAALYGLNSAEYQKKMQPLLNEYANPTIKRKLVSFIPFFGSDIEEEMVVSITGGFGCFCIDVFEERAIDIMRERPLKRVKLDKETFEMYKKIFNESIEYEE